MDSRQAREILLLYRPGADNPPDSATVEALELVRRDPDLAAWFGLHCAAQTKLPAGQMGLPVPPDFRRPIITAPTGVAAHRGAPIRATLILVALILVALALLLLAMVVYFFTSRDEHTFTRFRDRIVRVAQRSYPVKIVTGDRAQLREYFRANGDPLDNVQSAGLEKLAGKGGAVFPWHTHPVSMIRLQSDDNKDLYLFMANRQEIPKAPLPGKPQYNQIGRLMTVSWSDSEKVYVLTGSGDAASLQKYLK